MSAKIKPITKDRIEEKVEKIPEAGCWIWMGSTQVCGYGEILSSNRKMLAHRASYEVFIGPIPKGMYVCHACDNVYCVNPNHLFLGTQKQNMQDMVAKGRSTKGEKNARAKLTEEQVKQIREMSESNSFIAKLFHVSTSNIQFIKTKKRWAHV
jgi:hypothetical protein